MKWACGQRPYQAFTHSFLECACTRLFSIICFFLSISFNACEHLWVVRPSMNYLGHFYRIRLTRNRQNKELYIEQPVDSRKWRDSYPIGLVFKETNNETRSIDGSWPSAVLRLLLLSPSPFKIEIELIKKTERDKSSIIIKKEKLVRIHTSCSPNKNERYFNGVELLCPFFQTMIAATNVYRHWHPVILCAHCTDEDQSIFGGNT